MSLKGMDEVFARMEQATQQITKNVSLAISMVTNGTFENSQKKAPVLSGELKESGRMDLEPMKGTVTYGTDHCWYVELGTHKMTAEPYLFPAFKKNGTIFKKACKEVLKDL